MRFPGRLDRPSLELKHQHSQILKLLTTSFGLTLEANKEVKAGSKASETETPLSVRRGENFFDALSFPILHSLNYQATSKQFSTPVGEKDRRYASFGDN
jgi:hypothetical protein